VLAGARVLAGFSSRNAQEQTNFSRRREALSQWPEYFIKINTRNIIKYT